MGSPEGDVDAPESDVAHPEGDVAHPEGDVDNPEGDVANPEGDVADPKGDVDSPEDDVDNPGSRCGRSGGRCGQPGKSMWTIRKSMWTGRDGFPNRPGMGAARYRVKVEPSRFPSPIIARSGTGCLREVKLTHNADGAGERTIRGRSEATGNASLSFSLRTSPSSAAA